MNTASTPRTRTNNRSISSSSSSSSFSSSSSSFNFYDDPPPPSPSLSGVPFSWETLPGIPKTCRRSSGGGGGVSAKVSAFLPPPPPASSSATPRKQNKMSSSEAAVAQWDPFVAALVECSRDEKRSGRDREGRKVISWGGAKVSRSISDRFGSVSMYGSCKRVSSVSESIVYVVGSTGRPRNYGHRRSVG